MRKEEGSHEERESKGGHSAVRCRPALCLLAGGSQQGEGNLAAGTWQEASQGAALTLRRCRPRRCQRIAAPQSRRPWQEQRCSLRLHTPTPHRGIPAQCPSVPPLAPWSEGCCAAPRQSDPWPSKSLQKCTPETHLDQLPSLQSQQTPSRVEGEGAAREGGREGERAGGRAGEKEGG